MPAESNTFEFTEILVRSLMINFPNSNIANAAIAAIRITVPVAAKIFFMDMGSSLFGWIPEGNYNDLYKFPKTQNLELGRICLQPSLSLLIPILLRQSKGPTPLSPG